MFSDWTSADWVSIAISILFFIIAYFIGVRQGFVLREVNHLARGVHRLEMAIAELQIREKIGVIQARTFEARQKVPGAVFTLRQDTLSVLPLYEYAPKHLRSLYEDALCGGLRLLYELGNSETNADDLVRTIKSYITDLRQRRLPEHAEGLELCLTKVITTAT